MENSVSKQRDTFIENIAENIQESSCLEQQEEERLLTIQGTLHENFCPSEARTKSFVVVDNDVYARFVIEAFHTISAEVKFKSLFDDYNLLNGILFLSIVFTLGF